MLLGDINKFWEN